MGKMMIDDWEYHIRMLSDIAERNGASLILSYEPNPEKPDNTGAKIIIGYGKSILAMMCSLVDNAASDASIKPSELCDMISMFVKMNEGKP